MFSFLILSCPDTVVLWVKLHEYTYLFAKNQMQMLWGMFRVKTQNISE